jgi:pyruvate/2-oxoglutarate dehydrogenase complex dihydrolipoamide acyltransferase (E2) component
MRKAIARTMAAIPPPQVAILATGRAEMRAVVVDGGVVARTMLTATLFIARSMVRRPAHSSQPSRAWQKHPSRL